jgi:endonuclease-3
MSKRTAQPQHSDEAAAGLKTKAAIIYERLLEKYGAHPLVPRREPMHELISTILSHRTTQHNEALAYENMWRVFGSWDAIRDAPVEKLAEAVALANFAEVKAPYIKGILRSIYERRGAYSIDFLNDLPVQEALDWLMSMPGVGIKTATLVLLFCFGKPVMPVDTHVHRIAQRTGLIGPKVDPTAAHPLLWAILPPDPYLLFNYHVNNLLHGQRVCSASLPRCAACPLTDICDWYQANRAQKTP